VPYFTNFHENYLLSSIKYDIYLSNITTMETILLTIGLMAAAVILMAVGLFFGRGSLKGSCGGSGGCEVCSSGDNSCKNEAKV